MIIRLVAMKFIGLFFLALSVGGCGGYAYMGIQSDYDVFMEKKTEFPITYRVKPMDPELTRPALSPSIYIKPEQGSYVTNVNGWMGEIK